jgi:hypothetical protein
MRRVILIATLVPFVFVLGAAQAEAKEDHGGPIFGRAVITGPGLDEPIVIEGTLFADGGASALDFLIVYTGARQGGRLDGASGPAPALEALGPRYRIAYFLDDPAREGRLIGNLYPFQDLYPLAPGGPLVYTGPGWPLTGPGRWASAPATLRTMLVAYGLPRGQPVGDVPTAPADVPPGPSPLWVILVAAAGLAGLVVFGAIAGRPRRAVA